jgi:hypothetical protein
MKDAFGVKVFCTICNDHGADIRIVMQLLALDSATPPAEPHQLTLLI